MTEEERKLALHCLKASSDYHSEVCEECVNYPNCDHKIQDDVAETIIKALEQEPCGEVVSKQAVIDALNKTSGIRGDALKALYDLPPVTPQPKMGRWIVNEWGNISCSECGCTALYDKVYPGESVFGKAIRVKSNFCPTCGAKMKGSKR